MWFALSFQFPLHDLSAVMRMVAGGGDLYSKVDMKLVQVVLRTRKPGCEFVSKFCIAIFCSFIMRLRLVVDFTLQKLLYKLKFV